VKWTRVPDLVEKRKVFLRGGWAYVPRQEQSSIVFHEFESKLEKALEVSSDMCCGPRVTSSQMTSRVLPRLDEDTRLLPILNNLSQGFVTGISSEWANASGENTDEIKAEMVDDLAKKHFPLCMRTLHENLQRDNHLKHFGRLQYGLFLKVRLCLTKIKSVLDFAIGVGGHNRRSSRFLAQVIQSHLRRQVQQRIQIQYSAFIWSRGKEG